MNQISQILPPNESLAREFRLLATKFEKLALECGTRVLAFRDPSLPIFRATPVEQQRRAVDKLTLHLEIFQSARGDEAGPIDQKTLLWKAVKRLELMPPHDFFSKIGSEDVVELYDDNGLQLFSNFRFYDLCSYSIEEIACFDWKELWTRDESSLAQVTAYIQKALSGTCRETMSLDLPAQVLVERHSALRYEIGYRMKYMAPVTDRTTRRPRGFLLIEEGTLLKQIQPQLEESLFLRHESPLGG